MSLDEVFRQEEKDAAKSAAQALQDDGQYQLAKQHYEDSGCQAYLERIAAHVRQSGATHVGTSESRHGSPAVNHRVELSWRRGSFDTYSISVVATPKGDLIIQKYGGERFFRLKKWRRNKQVLEAAIADAYQHPWFHSRD